MFDCGLAVWLFSCGACSFVVGYSLCHCLFAWRLAFGDFVWVNLYGCWMVFLLWEFSLFSYVLFCLFWLIGWFLFNWCVDLLLFMLFVCLDIAGGLLLLVIDLFLFVMFGLFARAVDLFVAIAMVAWFAGFASVILFVMGYCCGLFAVVWFGVLVLIVRFVVCYIL